MTDIKSEAKEADSEFPEVDEDEDLEVVGEVIEEPLASTGPPDSKPIPSPSTTVSNESHKPNSSWTGFFGRRFSSGKGSSLGAESTTDGPKKRDWSKEQEALNKFKTQAVNTFNQMGTRMGEGGSFLLEASKRRAQATAETLKKIRIFKTPLESLCKVEAVNSPCPRLMLICCTTIAANGLSCRDIFKSDPPETFISTISEQLHHSNGLVLLPSDANAEVLAGVVKKFLMELLEPLLTYGLVEDWIEAGEDLERIKKIMDQLPVVNRNVLELFLACLRRISSNSAENNMDPDSLAEVLVPCLLWRAPTPSNDSSKKVFSSAGSMTGMFGKTPTSEEKGLKMHALPQDTSSAPDTEVESAKQVTRLGLQGEDYKKFSRVLSFMISNFKPETS